MTDTNTVKPWAAPGLSSTERARQALIRNRDFNGAADQVRTVAEAIEAACAEALADAAPKWITLQSRVKPWLLECFGTQIADDCEERNHRFLEEALELVQACGCSRCEAHQLVDYVYDRSAGEKDQEVGGVMITLAALCLAQRVDMHECGERELARIWSKIERIREKQASKPKHSPLPAPPQEA